VCCIGNERKRTKTHSGGGKKPQWTDTLVFNTKDNIMRVSVYDDDLGKDDLVGEATVNLTQLYNNPNRTENCKFFSYSRVCGPSEEWEKLGKGPDLHGISRAE
jgi:Ca2+-dependent lipid-binding protein